MLREYYQKLTSLLKENRKLILFIVFVAAAAAGQYASHDSRANYIPEYLYQLDHPEHAAGNFTKISSSSSKQRPAMTTSTVASAIWVTDPDSSVITPDDGGELFEVITTTELPPPSTLLYTRKPPRRRTTRAVTNATTLSPEDTELRHEELVEVNVRVGLMFASKAGFQLLANPFVGHLTNRFGYSIPMFTGFCIMFLSTVSK
ncbi:hypothetical protein BV898_01723 [Hypsibius exemplaris]|uniref:Major facilitator superfamily (MFS) profile domain-containing protein n=1 Tax=Hypsibius exemplaris TaxID=2072580 RepID=A0A1W0XB62_HYPEX|nr:hypothetical protein BV898_01723 [Hypsibius exemplaris]